MWEVKERGRNVVDRFDGYRMGGEHTAMRGSENLTLSGMARVGDRDDGIEPFSSRLCESAEEILLLPSSSILGDKWRDGKSMLEPFDSEAKLPLALPKLPPPPPAAAAAYLPPRTNTLVHGVRLPGLTTTTGTLLFSFIRFACRRRALHASHFERGHCAKNAQMSVPKMMRRRRTMIPTRFRLPGPMSLSAREGGGESEGKDVDGEGGSEGPGLYEGEQEMESGASEH